MISEIRYVTVGVADLERAHRFYEAVFGYVEHGSGSVSGAEFEELWALPRGMSGSVIVLGPEHGVSGLLRLLSVDAPGDHYWGDYSRVQDHGHFALNIRVPTLAATVDAITANGGRLKSSPSHWEITPELSAWDSMSYDADGTLLDVFELEASSHSPLSEYDGRPTGLQTVAIHSGDAARSRRFYEALGFCALYDKRLEGMESFFHLPTGVALHNINMMAPSAPQSGRVEISQYVNWPGRTQRDRAVPPARGILSASLETDDLDETSNRLDSLGAEAASGRVEVTIPGLGAVIARSYFGPDGERLEFYERR